MPGDFLGGTNKLDDTGEADEDDLDDDDNEVPVRAAAKRRDDGKVKSAPSESEVSMNVDVSLHFIPTYVLLTSMQVDYNSHHRTMAIQSPPISISSPSSGNSSLPISSHRRSTLRVSKSPQHHQSHPSSGAHKKPRITPSINSRSPSDDLIPNPHTESSSGTSGSGGGGYSYHPHPTTVPTSAFRPHHSSHQQNPPYAAFFPIPSPPNPPSFIPSTFDFPSTSGASPPRQRNSGDYPPRISSYDQAMYHQFMRQQFQQFQQQFTPDMFHPYMDKDENNRPAQGQHPSFVGIDWPGDGQPRPPSGKVTHLVGGVLTHLFLGQPSGGSPGHDTAWLDFLSESADSGAGSSGQGREAMSWERDHGEILEMLVGGGEQKSNFGRASVLASPLPKTAGAVGTANARHSLTVLDIDDASDGEGRGEVLETPSGAAIRGKAIRKKVGSGKGAGGGTKDYVKAEIQDTGL